MLSAPLGVIRCSQMPVQDRIRCLVRRATHRQPTHFACAKQRNTKNVHHITEEMNKGTKNKRSFLQVNPCLEWAYFLQFLPRLFYIYSFTAYLIVSSPFEGGTTGRPADVSLGAAPTFTAGLPAPATRTIRSGSYARARNRKCSFLNLCPP